MPGHQVASMGLAKIIHEIGITYCIEAVRGFHELQLYLQCHVMCAFCFNVGDWRSFRWCWFGVGWVSSQSREVPLDCTETLTEEWGYGKRLRMLAIGFHGLMYILVQNTRIHWHSNMSEESGEPLRSWNMTEIAPSVAFPAPKLELPGVVLCKIWLRKRQAEN